MKLRETCLYWSCLVSCSVSAFYFTYLQLKYYLHNEYPAFSICVWDYQGEIFERSPDIFNSTYITRESYRNYIEGNKAKEEYLAQLRDIKFDDIALDYGDIGYRFSSFSSQSFGHQLLVMIPTFRSSSTLCFSKNMTYIKDNRQKYDIVSLDSKKLYGGKLNVGLYVHQKGKLMRTFSTATAVYSPNGKMDRGIFETVDIGQIDILRKRDTGKIPCDNQMKNEDHYLLTVVMENAECIPTFWEHFAESIELNETIRMCTSTKDYQKIKEELEDALESFGKANRIYKEPCDLMTASVTTKDSWDSWDEWDARTNYDGTLRLRINYHQNMYRETLNAKAYTSETL